MDPDNSKYRAAEYQYYDKKYSIGSDEEELAFCVVSVGCNNNKDGIIEKYLGSLARQNSSNFHVIYVDDFSDDGSVDKLEQLLFLEYPEMKDKLSIIRNKRKAYSLANHHEAITNHCH